MKYIETQNEEILVRPFIHEGFSNIVLITGIGLLIYWFGSNISGYAIWGIMCLIFGGIGHGWKIHFIFDFETRRYTRTHSMLGSSFKSHIWDFKAIESIYLTTITVLGEDEVYKKDMDIYIKNDLTKYWVFFSEDDPEFLLQISKMLEDLAKFSIPIKRRNKRLN